MLQSYVEVQDCLHRLAPQIKCEHDIFHFTPWLNISRWISRLVGLFMPRPYLILFEETILTSVSNISNKPALEVYRRARITVKRFQHHQIILLA